MFHRERIQPLPYPPFDLLNPCVAPLTRTASLLACGALSSLLAGVDEATAYLLERTGDCRGAMRLLLQRLRSALGEADGQGPAPRGGGRSRAARVSKRGLGWKADAERLVESAAGLCVRSGASDRAGARRLWLEVFDVLLAWQLELGKGAPHADRRAFGESLTRSLIRHMTSAETGRALMPPQLALRHVFDTHEVCASQQLELSGRSGCQ